MSGVTDPFAIPRVTVHTGHVSDETAYVVDNHPYGGGLTCTIRYWVETAATGTHRGEQRFVYQTTNPRLSETTDGPVWNKQRPDPFAPIVVMYVGKRGRVRPYTVPFTITGPLDARIRAMGIYEAFTIDQRARYESLLDLSRRANALEWGTWGETISALSGHIATTRTDPVLEDGRWWTRGARRYFLPDPPAYVTAARSLAGLG